MPNYKKKGPQNFEAIFSISIMNYENINIREQ